MFRNISRSVFFLITVIFLSFAGRNLASCFASQTKIGEVLSGTSWVLDDFEVYYWKEGSLYFIKSNGTNERKIYDNVLTFEWFPNNKEKILIRTKGKEADLITLDLKSGQVELIEKEKDCSPGQLSSDGLKIIYEFGDNHYLGIYDMQTKTRKVVKMPEMITDVVVSKQRDIIYRGLFSKKCYQYNIATGTTKELSKFRTTKGSPELFDYINEEDIYYGPGSVPGSTGFSFPSPTRKMKAYTKNGSLWIQSDTFNDIFVEYTGPYSAKFSPGVEAVMWSPDERYVLFVFEYKIYVCDIKSKKIGYLTKGIHPITFRSSK